MRVDLQRLFYFRFQSASETQFGGSNEWTCGKITSEFTQAVGK